MTKITIYKSKILLKGVISRLSVDCYYFGKQDDWFLIRETIN